MKSCVTFVLALVNISLAVTLFVGAFTVEEGAVNGVEAAGKIAALSMLASLFFAATAAILISCVDVEE